MPDKGLKLTFHGGARSVTGSNYLLEHNGKKILVDCGLAQGGSFAKEQNFKPFPYDPAEIDAVFVSHAHIDHTGLIPKLVRDGFRGAIYSTPPTKAFAEYLLNDSEGLLRREAERRKEKPLYEKKHVQEALKAWDVREYHQPFTVSGFTIEFFDAGHILGSVFTRIKGGDTSVVFSGDLGNSPAPILHPLEGLPQSDYCLIESTYGDRLHDSEHKRINQLEDAIEDTVVAGGTLMIPAFSMERTQALLYHIHKLFEEGRVPKVPVFLDSPLAIKLTRVYKQFDEYFNKKTSKHIAESGDDILNFSELTLTLKTQASKDINNVKPPKIIIAGSGMSNGGRILHHEMRYLPDPKSCLLIVGYQASGSLGRQLVEGAKEVTIFGNKIPVKAHVKELSSYSAHADQRTLLDWLRPRRGTLKKVFVVQGEEDASKTLAGKIRDELAIHAEVPQDGQSVTLK